MSKCLLNVSLVDQFWPGQYPAAVNIPWNAQTGPKDRKWLVFSHRLDNHLLFFSFLWEKNCSKKQSNTHSQTSAVSGMRLC